MRTATYGSLLVATLLGVVAVLRGDAFTSSLRQLSAATYLVSEHGLFAVSPEELKTSGALGMVSVLDDYSTWHDRQTDTLIRREVAGHYGGFGIEIVRYGDTTLIWQVFPDSPAKRAGLKMGDRLLAADTVSLLGLPLDSVHVVLQTLPGSEVELTLARPGQADILRIRSARGRIEVGTVRVWDVLDGVAYITLEGFNAQTSEALAHALDTLTRAGASRFILDLRGNPGGLLHVAVECAELFMARSGTVVTVTEAGPVEHIDATVGPYPAQPLVVLVDAYSASGSELLAGCLQDWDRAVLIGGATFGKGFIQNLFPLVDESSLRLTIGTYQTPSGRTFYRPDSTQAPDTAHYTSLVNRRLLLGGGQIFPDLATDDVNCPSHLLGWAHARGGFEFAVQLLARPTLPPLEASLLGEFWNSPYNDYEEGLAHEFHSALPEQIAADPELRRRLEVARRAETVFDQQAVSDCLLYILSRHLARGYARISLLSPPLVDLDPALAEAMRVLVTPGRYESLLNGSRAEAAAEQASAP